MKKLRTGNACLKAVWEIVKISYPVSLVERSVDMRVIIKLSLKKEV
jgi:hypothetical protein